MVVLVSTGIYSVAAGSSTSSLGHDPNFHFEYGVPDGGRGYEEFGCLLAQTSWAFGTISRVTTADASLTLYVGAEVRITRR